MTKKTRDVDTDVDSSSWVYSWSPVKNSGPSSSYYQATNHAPVTWDNPIFRYHQEFLEKRGLRAQNTKNKDRMANIIPWLVSMSLIGAREFTALPGPDHISRELQAPPPLQISSGYASVADFQRSTSGLPVHITCDPPSLENSLEKKSSGYLQNNGYHEDSPSSRSNNNIPGIVPNVELRLQGKGTFDAFQNGVDLNNVQHLHASSVGNVDQRAQAYKTTHKYKPPVNTGFMDEYAGPAMELVYGWKTVDFEFENEAARKKAFVKGEYIPENTLPLGLEIWRDKLFVTLPRWKKGIPVTLATIPKNLREASPKLMPYPNWSWHREGNCLGLTSVFRVQVDECDRLWVLDSGQVDITDSPKQICPPRIFVFDLRTDRLLRKFALPQKQIKQDSLYSNIVVDVRNGNCNAAVAYLSDVWRFGIVAYDYSKDESFRVQHHFFFPDPLASRYDLHGLQFQWTDGIFGISLSPVDVNNDRTLFFHPLSSFREFAVSTSILRDKRTADENPEMFVPIGRPRAKDFGHSSGSAIDRNGVMFFNMATRDSVWCWDTRKEYIPQNLGVVGHSNVSLIFPNDIKVDHEEDQNVWVLSNKLPMYLYNHLGNDSVNYRIFRANVREAITNTVCDPNYVVPEFDRVYDDVC